MASDPWVSFRHEYVSGCVTVTLYPVGADEDSQGGSGLTIALTNRGHTEAVVRALFIFERNSTLKHDTGQVVIEPGAFFLAEFLPTQNNEIGFYWVHIFTTTDNVVPSLQVFNPHHVFPDGSQSPEWRVQWGPAEFARFDLPVGFRPVHIGPAEQ
jgi:hypothetical protein